jgi:hypothetical protein
MRSVAIGILTLTVGLAACHRDADAQILLRSYVISSGSVEASGDGYVLRGTVGQPIIGMASAPTMTLHSGFWYPLAPGAPMVAPVAVDDHASIAMNEAVDINVLENDYDPGGNALTIVEIGDPVHGSIEQKSDSVLTYIPADGFRGLDSLDYAIENTNGLRATARVRILVGEVNRPPIFVSTPVAGVAAGDLYRYLIVVDDPDGDEVEVSAALLPAWLALEDDDESAAVLTGSPSVSDLGVHSVTLVATDGIDSTTQSFFITVVEGVPPVVHLLIPADEAEDVLLDVMLEWNGSAGATFYRLVVSTTHDLSNPLVAAEEHADTTYHLHLLEPLKTYYWQVRGVNGAGEGEPSAIFRFTTASGVSSVDETELPAEFVLAQNYPNPFNPMTLIGFHMPENAHVRITVYDLVGRRVAVLVDEHRGPGRHEVTFDATTIPGGLYLYRMEVGGFSETRKMLLLR